MKQRLLLMIFLCIGLCISSACGGMQKYETTTVAVRANVGEAREELEEARRSLEQMKRRNAQLEKTIGKLDAITKKAIDSENSCIEIARVRGVLPSPKKK